MRITVMFVLLLWALSSHSSPKSNDHTHQTELVSPDERATLIVVDKSERTLWLYRGDEIIKTYRKVRLGRNPKGHKVYDGDDKTPEGTYEITERKDDSGYHLALRVSYPNREDRQRKLPRGKKIGGDIMIHGAKTWHWTNGCIALTNEEIDEIFPLVANGTPIKIRW